MLERIDIRIKEEICEHKNNLSFNFESQGYLHVFCQACKAAIFFPLEKITATIYTAGVPNMYYPEGPKDTDSVKYISNHKKRKPQ